MKRIFILLTVLLLSVAFTESLPAQWKIVAPKILYKFPWPFNLGMPIQLGAIHFKDGIIWAGWEELVYSADTGKTWVHTNFSDVSGLGLIEDIAFYDKNTGVVSTWDNNLSGLGPIGQPGIFLTTDGGKTWKHINDAITYYRLEFGRSSDHQIHAYEGADPIGSKVPRFMSTKDSGKTWHNTEFWKNFGPGMSCITTKNNVTYILTSSRPTADSGFVKYTTDEGETWKQFPTPIDRFGSAFNPAIDIDSCSPDRMYITNCAWPISCFRTIADEFSEIFYSTNAGATWEVGFSHPGKYIAGSFASAPHSLYAQTISDGILRSTDQGINWKRIGGPSNIEMKCNRSLCAINDNIIFGLDSIGNIWATYNSGGDPLSTGSSSVSAAFSSARIINDSFNITVHLPIYFHHTGTMSDVDMIMHYPTASLQYLNGTVYNGKSIDVAGSQWPGRAALHFAAADLNAAPDSLLGYANFRWTPFEYSCEEILFDSVDTHTTETPCSGSTKVSPFTGIIGSYKTCGLSGVAENAMNSAPLDFSIHPNPARTSIRIEIANASGKVQFELFDELGIARRKGMTSENRFGIDLIGLAEGNYYLRISQGGGTVATKSVLVLK